MIGERFGRLVVTAHAGHDRYGFNKWVCACDCGCEVNVLQGSLKRGLTQSCGCLNRELAADRLRKIATKHGACGQGRQNRLREYRSWEAAKRRCFNKADPKYPRYGGRGITMCDAWRNDFRVFFKDMGPSAKGLSIDRINNDGNYEPGNCRWATAKQQANNQSRPRKVN